MLALVAADKLDNVRAITDTLRHLGQEKTWALFNADRSDQHWYYRRIAEILLDKDPKSRLFRTLDFETQTSSPIRGTRRPSSPESLSAPLTMPGRISPTRSSTGARTTRRSSSRRAGSALAAFRRASWTCSRPATPTRAAGSSKGSSSVRSISVRKAARARPTCSCWSSSPTGYGVIAVEGKAREPFGPLVSEWNDGPGKQARLDGLCEQLGLDPSAVGRPSLPAPPSHGVRAPRGTPIRRPRSADARPFVRSRMTARSMRTRRSPPLSG